MEIQILIWKKSKVTNPTFTIVGHRKLSTEDIEKLVLDNYKASCSNIDDEKFEYSAEIDKTII